MDPLENLKLELEKAKNKCVLVEGKKDETVLKNLGFKNIVSLKNRPLFEVIKSIGEKEVVLLTDIDEEGKKLFAVLRLGLQRKGIKINNKLRREVSKLGLKQVEGLGSFLKNHQKEAF